MDTTMNALETLKSRRYLLAGMAILGILLAVEWKHVRGDAAPPAAPVAAQGAALGIVHAEGRVVAYPGAEVVVGTDVGGRLRALPLVEKMRVKKGDLVAEIDADEQKAALAEA